MTTIILEQAISKQCSTLFVLLTVLVIHCECQINNCSSNALVAGKGQEVMIADTFFSLFRQYDKHIRPDYLGDPTIITIDFSVLNFGSLNEVGMTFTVDLMFNQLWSDYRLSHTIDQDIIPLLGRRTPSDYIWTPDTVFANAKKAKMHKVTINNDKLVLKRNGIVFWSTRATVEAACPMDFRKYPLDTQTCNLTVQSYAYTSNHIIYKWKSKDAIKIISSEMSQYTVDDVNVHSQMQEFPDIGKYSQLTAQFVFKRQVSVTIIQLFFPATAIVSVSWVSLWIHKNCVSARVGLGVTTMLTICAFWGSVNRQLPRVNYVKAVDIYFIVSFCFILLTLLEYTVVLNLKFNLWKKKKVDKKTNDDQEKRNQSLKRSVSDTSHIVRRKISQLDSSVVRGELVCEIDNTGRTINYTLTKKEEKKKKRINYKIMPYFYKSYSVTGKPGTLDVVSRFMFPFMYLCFNIFFWMIYSQEEKGDPDGGHHI